MRLGYWMKLAQHFLWSFDFCELFSCLYLGLINKQEITKIYFSTMCWVRPCTTIRSSWTATQWKLWWDCFDSQQSVSLAQHLKTGNGGKKLADCLKVTKSHTTLSCIMKYKFMIHSLKVLFTYKYMSTRLYFGQNDGDDDVMASVL